MPRMDTPHETHEPRVPQNWPKGHVSVGLTGPEDDECVLVTIHGVKHYLHATTASELSKMLAAKIATYNVRARQAGLPTV